MAASQKPQEEAPFSVNAFLTDADTTVAQPPNCSHLQLDAWAIQSANEFCVRRAAWLWLC